MAKLTVKSGSSTRSEYIFVNDSSSTSGAGLTGLTNATAGLTCYYVTERGTPTAITLTSLASATAAYSSGGFVAVDATNMPGVYRIDIPSAVFATTKGIVMLKGATNMVPVLLEYNVVAYDPTDTVRLGLTALPNIAQGTSGAIATGNATGQVTVATNNDKTGYSLTQAFPTNFASLAITGAGAVTAGTVSDKTGYSLTQAFPANFSSLAVTVGGAVTAGTVSDKTGYSLATSQTFSTTGSVGSVTGSVGSVTGNVTLAASQTFSTTGSVGSVTGSVGSVTGAVGSVTGSVGSFSTGAIQSIWDDLTVNNTVVGSIGKLVVDNLNATVSSRSTLAATDVWSAATRTITGGTVTTNSDKTGYSLGASQTFSTTGSVGSVTGSVGSVTGNVTLGASQTFSTTGSVGSVTGAVTVGTNNDKTGYALTTANQGDIAGLTWDQLRSAHAISGSFGEYVNTNGSGPGGSTTVVRMGPFQLIADGVGTPIPLDIQTGSQHGVDIQCVDNNLSAVDITGATVTAKVYNSGGSLVSSYTCSPTYAADGRAVFTITTAVTATPGTYTLTVTRTTGSSDTQIFGPLRMYVRNI